MENLYLTDQFIKQIFTIKPLELSVIIVNYNVKHFLEQCLISVQKAIQGIDSEIIVVDNNSVDGSTQLINEKFGDIHLIANSKNTGFAVANNQAIKLSKGKFILLLNPDTIVQEDTFVKCLEFMDANSDAGALGLKMFDGNGHFLPESKRGLPTPSVAFCKIFGLSALFPKSKVFGQYHLGYLSNDENHVVDVLSGAFMLIRRETLEKVGLLDESFFMYGEDIDLSYRITLGGYKNYYFSKTNIIHYKGESTKKSSINYVFVFYRAMIIFAEKHFSKKNVKTFSRLINAAIYFRASVAVIQRLIRRWSLSMIEFILFTGLIYGFSILYQQFSGISFPNETIKLIIPFYALVWTITNRSLGNHIPPLKLTKLLKANLIGLLILLAIYALIPKSIQFSRAVILGSSLITLILSYLLRYSFQILNIGLFKNFKQNNKTLAIIGSVSEIQRFKQLTTNNNQDIKKIYKINPEETKVGEDGFDGNISQINEFIMINKIDEVIFCSKDISAQKIIYSMANVKSRKNIDFKIIPEKSQFIIGSQSIYTNDNLYTTELKHINSPENIRKKRVFDLYTCLALVIFSPFFILFCPNYFLALKELKHVLIGRKTWLGYQDSEQNSNLPIIKKSVFSVVNDTNKTNIDVVNKVNIIYAKDYSLLLEFNLLMKRIFKF